MQLRLTKIKQSFNTLYVCMLGISDIMVYHKTRQPNVDNIVIWLTETPKATSILETEEHFEKLYLPNYEDYQDFQDCGTLK